jgi:hypothetical protein
MTSIASIGAATRTIDEDTIAAAKFVIVTAEQYDLLKTEAARLDLVPNRVYRPDGTPVMKMRTAPAMLGRPVAIRATGVDITDLGTPVIDLRSA